MKGKQLAILLVVVIVLGGVWYLLGGPGGKPWSETSGGGVKVVEFPLNDVAQIVIQSPAASLHLVKKADEWTVQERAGYPASFEEVSDLLRKLWELKRVQIIKVGPSQLPRLELVEPGKGEKAGTLVQLLGADGKPLNAVILGKKYLRKSEGAPEQDFGGLGAGGYPAGRYVKRSEGETVSLVSQTFDDADPKPERWLAKDFVKIDGPKSIAVVGPTDAQHWTVARENASAEWTLADIKPDEKLDAAKTSPLNSVFAAPSFSDVLAPDAKLEDPVTTATIETFDGFHYELKIAKANGDNYPVLVKVSASFPKERTPGKDEKPEDKTRLDREFAAKQKSLEEKLAKEKPLEARAYLVAKYLVDPLLKDRSNLLVTKPAETPALNPAPASTPVAPAVLAPAMTAPGPVVPIPAAPVIATPAPTVAPPLPTVSATPVTVTTPPMTAPTPAVEAVSPPVQVPAVPAETPPATPVATPTP